MIPGKTWRFGRGSKSYPLSVHPLYIAIDLKTANSSYLLISLYRPPNTNVKEFLSEYKTLLTEAQSITKNVILGMDHNLDLLKLEKHSHTENFLNCNLANGLFHA